MNGAQRRHGAQGVAADVTRDGGLVTIAINLVVHNIVVNVISPRLMKTTVNVHPAVTLIAILIGEGLCGVLGMLLAVPVVAALQTIFVTYFET